MRTLLFVLALGAVGSASAAPFTLIAAETRFGSQGGNTNLYGGLQQYDFANTGGTFTSGPGVPASQLSDPAGVMFIGANAYVSNRHGNNQGQGSIKQFSWDGTSLTGGTTIAIQSNPAFQGFHGFDFAPNGDLFITTVNAGTRRYRDSGSGYVDIGGVASGAVRDALISADGSMMYETTPGSTLRITPILPNGFGTTTTFNVSGASAMHQMAWRNGSIYLTSLNSNSIHRIDLDANQLPVSSTVVATATSALGLAFSPDGNEMFVSGHTSNAIFRFLDVNGTWTSNGQINTGHNMGGLAVVPEPASMIALGAGLVALAARRRRRA